MRGNLAAIAGRRWRLSCDEFDREALGNREVANINKCFDDPVSTSHACE